MDIESIVMLLVALGGIGLIYIFPPRWVAKLIPKRLIEQPDMWDDEDHRVHFFGKVLASMALYFFSGIEDGEGNEMEPHAAAMMFINQLFKAEHDRVAYELPMAMSSMSSTKTAKKMQEKSAFARGVADTGEGIPFQAIKKTASEIFAGFGKGVVGGGGKGMGFLGDILPLVQQVQETGILDKLIKGGQSQEEQKDQYVPRTGSPV